MIDRIRTLSELNGLPIKDSARMPHPADLAEWADRYEIDVDLGVFRVLPEQREDDV